MGLRVALASAIVVSLVLILVAVPVPLLATSSASTGSSLLLNHSVTRQLTNRLLIDPLTQSGKVTSHAGMEDSEICLRNPGSAAAHRDRTEGRGGEQGKNVRNRWRERKSVRGRGKLESALESCGGPWREIETKDRGILM